jgi:hypothetical protein
LASFSNDFFSVANEFKGVIHRRIKSKSKKLFGTSPMEFDNGWPQLRVSYHQYQESVYGNFDNKITMSVVMGGIVFEAIYRNSGVFLRPQGGGLHSDSGSARIYEYLQEGDLIMIKDKYRWLENKFEKYYYARFSNITFGG